jgi:hypothetical protein
MVDIQIDTWLYGSDLAKCAGEASQGSFANLQICLPENSTVRNLLDKIGLDTKQRGITFINGDLSAMPGLQPDLDHILVNGDRVAFFHLRAMWPFQYRNGAAMVDEMKVAMLNEKDQGLHHNYEDIQ